MTFKLLFDIAFWIVIVVCFGLLIIEMIPEFVKKYWGYQRQLRRDKKNNRRGKYNITFRV